MNLLKGHPAAGLAGFEDRDRERARDASYRCNSRHHRGPLTIEDREVVSPADRPSRRVWLQPPRWCLGLGAALLLTIRNGPPTSAVMVVADVGGSTLKQGND